MLHCGAKCCTAVQNVALRCKLLHRGATVALRCNMLHRYESACGFSALAPHRMGGRVLTVPCHTNYVRLVDPWTTYPSSTPLRQSLRASPRGVGRVLDLFFKYPQSSTRVCPLKHPGLVPDGVPLSTPTTSTPSAVVRVPQALPRRACRVSGRLRGARSATFTVARCSLAAVAT